MRDFMTDKSHFYLIASGSNRRHGRYGGPSNILRVAHHHLERHQSIDLIAEAPILSTPAMGAAKRRFANSGIWIATHLDPPVLLALLKATEREFGRKKRGQRWVDRVLDLDIILWSGGIWTDGTLSVPHPEFRRRSFVLRPLNAIAPSWRDPITTRSLRQLIHMLDRPRNRP